MKIFNCSHCGRVTFFENVQCEGCLKPLGFVPEHQQMWAFDVQADQRWLPVGGNLPGDYAPCQNYRQNQVCNWMVAAGDGQPLCRSCRYTEMIPSLSAPAHIHLWFLLESAKRRLIYALTELGLPLPDRAADPERGLVFHFLAETPDEPALTGHDSGLITINVDEADDATREARRAQMHEPYRTLLGHFRHEIGHFYWTHLVEQTNWLMPFRAVFGDETEEYSQAMDRYYAQGAPADWPKSFISEYATMHPWEDWAETWAHYLHIVDALDTAHHWGVHLGGRNRSVAARSVQAEPVSDAVFRHVLVRDWLPLSQFLNSMNRSLGQKDSYPFVLPDAVINKLALIHQVVHAKPLIVASH